MKIFLAEDDILLCRRISRFLTSHGFEVHSAVSEGQLTSEIEEHLHSTDMFLLDVHLDSYSVLSMLPWIRENSDQPVILISADVSEDSILRAYSLKADDYIEKPVRPQILLAKINTIARRAGLLNQEIRRGEWIFDRQSGKLTQDEEAVSFAGPLKTIFEKLFYAYPSPVSKEILKSALSTDYTDGALRVRMSELRKLLPVKMNLINRRAEGYQLVMNAVANNVEE